MRLRSIFVLALVLASSGALPAFAQRVVTGEGAIADKASGICFDTDVSAADGDEACLRDDGTFSSPASGLDGTGSNPDLRADTSCLFGFRHDIDGDGLFDNGDDCASPDFIFDTTSYTNGSTSVGGNEAIVAACASWPTTPYGGVVRLGVGNLQPTAPIDILCDRISLIGHGFQSRLMQDPNTTAVRIVANTPNPTQNIVLRDFLISVNAPDAHAGNIGINADTGQALGGLSFEDLVVTGASQLGLGLRLDHVLKSSLINVKVSNWGDGALFTGGAGLGESYPNNNSIFGGLFSANADDGIEIQDLHSDFNLFGVSLESNGGDGIQCDAAGSGNDKAIVNVFGGYSESNAGSTFHRPAGGCPFRIRGFRWSDTVAGPDFKKVGTGDLDVIYDGEFSTNGISNASGEPIHIVNPVNADSLNCSDPAVCIIDDLSNVVAAGAQFGQEPDGSYLECDPAIGICPNPLSTLLLDTRTLFIGARGGVRDDDGSMWTGPGTENDEYDFINSSTVVATAAGGAPYVLTSSSADAFDLLACRDTATEQECTTGATCVSNIQGISDPVPWTWCDGTTGVCQGFSATAYAGCNTAIHNLTGVTPRLTTNAGTAQLAMPDGVHPASQMSKLLAQTLLGGMIEFLEYPVSDATNLIANGHATSAATGWSEAGSGTLAHDAAEAIPADFQNGNWYNGGVLVSGRVANTDALLTPTMTTRAGTWYVAKGYARLNSVGTEDIVVQAIDASAGTPLATQATYIVYGGKYKLLTGSASDLDRECYGGCYFIVKFLATDSDVQISISSNAGTGNIYADNWIGMPAPSSRLGLTPLFPGNGGVALHVEGDSRSNDADEFADAIDDAVTAGVPRANFALADKVFRLNTNATGGRSADNVVTSEGYRAIRLDSVGRRYTIVFLGVNDVGGGTPASVAADWADIARRIRQRGGRPIIVLELPYRGNTNLTTCEGGTENCTTTIDELADLMMHSATGVLHQ